MVRPACLLRLCLSVITWITRWVVNVLSLVPLLAACILPWRMVSVASGLSDRCEQQRFRNASSYRGTTRAQLAVGSFPCFALSHFGFTLLDILTLPVALACAAIPWRLPQFVRIIATACRTDQANDVYYFKPREYMWYGAFCGFLEALALALAPLALCVPSQTCLLLCGLRRIWRHRRPRAYSWVLVDEHDERMSACAFWGMPAYH